MTAADIMNIAVTVGLSQLASELLANYFIFNGDPYKRKLAALERAKWKLEKAEADAAKSNKHEKRLQRAKDEYAEICSSVAKSHSAPGIYTSIFFVILLRILGAEHKGKVMALLPFVPLKFITRVTARGLDWSVVDDETVFADLGANYQQATSYLFIYFCSALSVKFFVSKAFGTQPPPGADRGFMNIMESPGGKRLLKNFGVDPDELMKEA